MKKVEGWVSPSAAITKAEAQTTKAFKNKHCNSRQGAGEAISRSGETWRSTGSHQTSFHKAAGNCHSKRCLTGSSEASFPKEDSVTVLFRKALPAQAAPQTNSLSSSSECFFPRSPRTLAGFWSCVQHPSPRCPNSIPVNEPKHKPTSELWWKERV